MHIAVSPYSESKSAAYRVVLERARRFAQDRRATILIEGESGTGKTMLARYIHQHSPRATGPYHAVVLSALDDALAGSELFGHVAGAFTDARQSRAGTFVSANGGTLFLDEIGKASLSVQQKLLNAVEYGEIRPLGSDRDMRVDARVIVASNIPLAELVAKERFLADLYARLSTFRIVLPPLRDRRADIPALVESYLARHAQLSDIGLTPKIAPELMKALQTADWPANLRQLDATVHRLLVDAAGASVISLDYCTDDLAYLRGAAVCAAPLTSTAVHDAISRAGSVSGAARLLGVHRTTLHRLQRRWSVALRPETPPKSVALHRRDDGADPQRAS